MGLNVAFDLIAISRWVGCPCLYLLERLHWRCGHPKSVRDRDPVPHDLSPPLPVSQWSGSSEFTDRWISPFTRTGCMWIGLPLEWHCYSTIQKEHFQCSLVILFITLIIDWCLGACTCPSSNSKHRPFSTRHITLSQFSGDNPWNVKLSISYCRWVFFTPELSCFSLLDSQPISYWMRMVTLGSQI